MFKITNGSLQFLYILLCGVRCDDKESLISINKALEPVTTLVLEYEKKQEQFKQNAQIKMQSLQGLKGVDFENAVKSINTIEEKMDILGDELIEIELDSDVVEFIKIVLNDALTNGYENNDRTNVIKGRRVTRMMLELMNAFD